MDWMSLAKALGPTVISSLFNYGANKDASKAQAKALNEQLKLARAQFDLQRRQAEMDLPYRRNLFNALQGRVNRQIPRFMQRSYTPTNPYANVRRVMPSNYSFKTPGLQQAFAGRNNAAISRPSAINNPSVTDFTS